KIRSILLNLKKKIKGGRDVSFNFDYTKELGEDNAENFKEIISTLEDMARLAEENPMLFKKKKPSVLYNLVQKNKQKIQKLLDHLAGVSELTNVLAKHKVYTDLLSIEKGGLDNLETIKVTTAHALWLKDVLAKVKHFAKDSLPLLASFDESHSVDIDDIREYINAAKQLKNVLLGYLGKTKDIEKLNQGFRKRFALSKFDEPHKHVKELEAIVGIYEYILELRDEQYHPTGVDMVHLVTAVLKDDSLYFTDEELSKMESSLDQVSKAEVLAKEISNSKLTVASLGDLNDLAVASEVTSLYDELNELLKTEKELIESNIDVKKNKNIDVLFQGNNISELMQEIATCKEYINTLIEINDVRKRADRYIRS
ncbi:MAG: hypothetical protein NT108_00805, partial [Candidatus Kaiserbacteria bacterium]|nr:hypothetical protein [Candidatus Kaiserbacteria bacterium]